MLDYFVKGSCHVNNWTNLDMPPQRRSKVHWERVYSHIETLAISEFYSSLFDRKSTNDTGNFGG